MSGLGPGLVHALRVELLVEMALAVVLGGLVGLERELKNKPAGLRTNILICLGCTLFTSLSHWLGAEGGDPGRIAAQMVTGLGFLGAGAILHSGGAVIGLTTAATIWVVAALGMALGFGLYQEAVVGTAFVLAVLIGLGWLEALIDRREIRGRLVIRLRAASGATVDELAEMLRRTGLEVTPSRARQGDAEVLALELAGRRRLHEQALALLLRHPGVHTVAASD